MVRTLNYISFAGNGDIKWVVDWSGGYSVKIGTWELGKAYRVRAEIDFVNQTADVYLGFAQKLIAKDLPALPKEFDHQRWGHVKLSKFGLSTGNFRDSGTNVVYFDDIRLETFHRIWPVDAPTTTCYTSGGKALPSTGENSADWFNYGNCGNWKVFDVTPGKELKFALRSDQCPSCPGCVLGDIDFDIYEYVNGQWVLKKSVDGPNNYCGLYDYFYYYTPQSDRIKVVARGGFYLELYQEFDSSSSTHAPIANAGGPYTANEGEEITFNASLSHDPDGDSLQYRWDFDNDGVWDTEWLNEPIISHAYVDDYQGTVVLEVTDGELTTKATADVTVLNVPPSVNITADDEVYAGAGLIINAAFTDPGDDAHTATIDWGDGVVDSITNAVSPIVANHTYNTKGVYTINVTVIDDDGGVGYNSVNVKVKVINATVEFGMDTLNLKSKVKWILCYIELEEGNVTQINGSTVYLEYNNTTISAYIGEQGWAKSEATDGNIVDSDGDGLLERMVGFNKSSIEVDEGEHLFYVKGRVAYHGYMVWFEGSDVLKVINKEKEGAKIRNK
ncbi:MAG: PKD domain-containing protein [Archaeoglobus sp.]|nr:PKD domain-containing protein [Archaeoglobus sp.]